MLYALPRCILSRVSKSKYYLSKHSYIQPSIDGRFPASTARGVQHFYTIYISRDHYNVLCGFSAVRGRLVTDSCTPNSSPGKSLARRTGNTSVGHPHTRNEFIRRVCCCLPAHDNTVIASIRVIQLTSGIRPILLSVVFLFSYYSSAIENNPFLLRRRTRPVVYDDGVLPSRIAPRSLTVRAPCVRALQSQLVMVYNRDITYRS